MINSVIEWLKNTFDVKNDPRGVSFDININPIADRISKRNPESFWIPPSDQAINVSGFSLKGGMIYFGSGLASVNGYSIEPALIDPKLPVNRNENDDQGANMHYWPSYDSIEPASRHSFLKWLEDGRRDPSIGIGYVFLFFYGLERRIISDLASLTVANNEIKAILDELKRLKALYPNSGSFQGYSGSLIDYIELKYFRDNMRNNISSLFEGRYYDMPLKLKMILSKMALENKRLPADVTLALLKCDPSRRTRTPERRCKEEFNEMFKIKYAELNPDGILLISGSNALKYIYHSASSSLRGMQVTLNINMSEVKGLTKVLKTLDAIADEVVNDLETYSRSVVDAKDTFLEALAYLPRNIVANKYPNETASISNFLKSVMANNKYCQIDMRNLMDNIFKGYSKPINKTNLLLLSQILSKYDVGIEPDIRFVNQTVNEGNVILFDLQKESPIAPSIQYSLAANVLRLAVAIGKADKNFSSVEKQHLENSMVSIFQLTEAENMRLEAYMQWLELYQTSFSGIRTKLHELKYDFRERIGKLLIGIAQADGYIDPNELKVLSRVYKILDLDTEDLYSHAHEAATEPVIVATADKETQIYVIPSKRNVTDKKTIDLDMMKIEIKLDESASISSILNGIFSKDEPELGVASNTIDDKVGIMGFDSESSDFIRIITSKDIWTREDLEEIAKGRGVMLDGMLENINETAFRIFDKPLIEGEDVIEINQSVVKELFK